VLVASGATASADQYRLQKTNSISLSSLFYGGSTPSQYGASPLSVAFDGTNAYLGGYNSSSRSGRTGVVKVAGALGATPALSGLAGTGAILSVGPSRGIDHLDTYQGDIILSQTAGPGTFPTSSVVRRIDPAGNTVWNAFGSNLSLHPFAMAIDPKGDAGSPAIAIVSEDGFGADGQLYKLKLSNGQPTGGSAGVFSSAGRSIGYSPGDISFDSQGNVALITSRGTGYGRRTSPNNFVSNPVTGGSTGLLGALSHQPPDASNNGNAVAILEGAGTVNFLATATRVADTTTHVLTFTDSTNAVQPSADARAIQITNLDGTRTGITQTTLVGDEDFLGAPYIGQIKGFNTGRDANGNSVLLVADFSGNRLDVYQVEPTWTGTNGGTWSNSANWQIGLVANGATQNARFPASAVPQTIVVSDFPETKLLKLEGATGYTLSGGGGIRFIAPAGVAANIAVTGTGSHSIDVPIALSSDIKLRVASSATLSINGFVRPMGGNIITKLGGGTANLKRIAIGTLNVAEGRLALIAGGSSIDGASRVGTLIVQAGATLDLRDKGVAISNATPFADLLAAVGVGFNGGAWTGTGIMSSTAAANPNAAVAIASNVDLGVAMFMGQTVQPTDTLVRYTLKGDCDLNGAVNFDDLLRLAANYNASGTKWTTGDANYDGTTNFDDLLALAANYSQSLAASLAGNWALSQSAVPEPTALLAVVLAPIALRRTER
jgi:hypothetical protein